MGIADLRQHLSDIPDIQALTMRYEDGGKVQVFTIGNHEARVGPDATNEEIRAALVEALK